MLPGLEFAWCNSNTCFDTAEMLQILTYGTVDGTMKMSGKSSKKICFVCTLKDYTDNHPCYHLYAEFIQLHT
jgi:hypothetical protein